MCHRLAQPLLAASEDSWASVYREIPANHPSVAVRWSALAYAAPQPVNQLRLVQPYLSLPSWGHWCPVPLLGVIPRSPSEEGIPRSPWAEEMLQ
jgi:hypothetical protein